MASMNASLRQAWNDRVLKYESNSSEYKCTVCDKVYAGEAAAVDHLKSRRHSVAGTRQALTNLLNSQENPPSLQQLLPTNISVALNRRLITVTESKDFRCNRCRIDIGGIGHLEEHLKSSGHKKTKGSGRQSQSPASTSSRPCLVRHLSCPTPCERRERSSSSPK